jgi:hypothetical protein
MPWRLWLALCIAVHGTLAADVRRSRQLTQTADTDVALQVHLSEPALLRCVPRTVHPGRLDMQRQARVTRLRRVTRNAVAGQAFGRQVVGHLAER